MKADDFLDGKDSGQNADAFLDGGSTPATVVEKLDQIESGRKSAELSEPSAGEFLGNSLKKGVSAFLGFPGDIVDFARDLPLAPHPALIPLRILMDRGADKLGLRVTKEMLPTKNVIATSELFRDFLGVDQNMKTSDPALRIAGGISEMAGAGGPFGLVTKAPAMVPLVTGIIGSGIGLALGGDAAEGLGVKRNIGEAIGTFAGGLGPAVTGALATKVIGAIKGRFSKGSQINKAEREALNEVSTLIDEVPASGINLERSKRVSDEFAKEGINFTPSLPAKTNSPGMLAIEKNLVTDNPSALNRASKNAEDVQLQIADFIDAKFPVTKAQPAAKRVQDLMKLGAANLEKAKTQADDALDNLTAVFNRNPENFQNGQKIRQLFVRQKEVYQATRDAKYKDVYQTADRLGIRDNIDDVVTFVDDTLKSDLNAFTQAEIPSVFREVKRKFIGEQKELTGRSIPPDLLAESTKGKPADVSFEEMHSLLKRTNSDLAVLRGSGDVNAPTKIRLLENVKTMLTAKLDSYQNTAFGPVAEKLRDANRFYQTEYLPRFKQGFGSDISSKFTSGEFRTPHEKVTELITKANNVQAAKDFKLLFDDVPEAWNALRDGYMDTLFRNAGVIDANGRIKKTAMDAFLRKNAPTLDQFPQIKADIQLLSTNNAALLERQARIAVQQKELHAAELFKMFNGGDANRVLDTAVTNPQAMRLLAVNAKRGGPEMSKAFARSIAEQVMAKDDPVQFFFKNEEAIRNGLAPLGAEHFKNMRTAIEAVGISQRSIIPQTVRRESIVPDSIFGATGNSARAFIAAGKNIARGRSGPVQEGSFLLGQSYDKLRRDHKAVVLESIFYDTDTSKVMANLSKNPASEKARSDFATQMVKLGVQTEAAGQE